MSKARPITADDLTVALEQGLDADAQMPTPEAAGFAPDALRDFLRFVQGHGGFEVPIGPTGNEPVHYGSLMAGLVLGAVAARRSTADQQQHSIEEGALQRAIERVGAELFSDGVGRLDGALGNAIADAAGNYSLEFVSPEQLAEGIAHWLREFTAPSSTEEERG